MHVPDCPVSKHHLLKRLCFLIVYFCFPLSEIDRKCEGLFLGSLFCSINYYACFVSISRSLDYYSFEVLSEVWGLCLQLCYFPQDCFDNLMSLMVTYKILWSKLIQRNEKLSMLLVVTITIVKIAILPKATYRFNTIPIKPMTFFHRTETNVPKINVEYSWY